MFRPFSLAIFKLINEKHWFPVPSLLAHGAIDVGVEVSTFRCGLLLEGGSIIRVLFGGWSLPFVQNAGLPAYRRKNTHKTDRAQGFQVNI